jgi:hypothetical protein
MSAHDLSAVQDFFVEFDVAQLDTWNLKLQPDAGRVATLRQEMKLDGYTEGKASDMVKVLARPGRPDDAWFAKHGERTVGRRTIHAIQPVDVAGAKMALVYTNAFERNELGMNERFAVAEADGGLRVVSHQTRCGECGGAGCGVCKGQGWRHAGGRQLGACTASGEALKLEAPEHEDTRALYDAL